MNPNKKTGGDSMVDYSPLWNTLKERGITQYYLLKNGIDNKTLDSLKKNYVLSLTAHQMMLSDLLKNKRNI